MDISAIYDFFLDNLFEVYIELDEWDEMDYF